VRKAARNRIAIAMMVLLTLSGIALVVLHVQNKGQYEPAVIFAIYGFAWIGLVSLNRKKSGRG